ncbi:MAG: hypothetical protein Q7R95_06105 [bacterium]|nr:hypothetical protein [bacterium]
MLGDEIPFTRACKNQNGFVELQVPSDFFTMSPQVAHELGEMLIDVSKDPVPA